MKNEEDTTHTGASERPNVHGVGWPDLARATLSYGEIVERTKMQVARRVDQDAL